MIIAKNKHKYRVRSSLANNVPVRLQKAPITRRDEMDNMNPATTDKNRKSHNRPETRKGQRTQLKKEHKTTRK